MIKKMKAAWQRYLDKVAPVPEQPRAVSAAPEFFAGAADPATAALPRMRPVHNTAPMVLRELREDVAMEEAVARSYEEDLGPITMELLRDLDQTFSALVSEAMAARLGEQARCEGQATWQRVMVERRSARNQAKVLVDVEHLWRDDITEDERRELVCAGIRARALHASDPEAPTGLIPVMTASFDMIEEEDTA